MNHTDADQSELDRNATAFDPNAGHLKDGCRHIDPVRFKNAWIYTENLKHCIFGLLPRALTERRKRPEL